MSIFFVPLFCQKETMEIFSNGKVISRPLLKLKKLDFVVHNTSCNYIYLPSLSKNITANKKFKEKDW